MYVAEEILQGQAYGTKVDVHSFGVVLLEVACVSDGKHHAFVRRQFMGHGGRGAVMRGWRPSCPSRLAKLRPELAELIRDCGKREPKERPDFSGVISRLKAVGPDDWRRAASAASDPAESLEMSSGANVVCV